MGEKIRNIGGFNIGDKKILIELNEAYNKNSSKYDIHIESEYFQYSLSNKDYIRLTTTLVNACEMLNAMKTKKGKNII